MRCSLMARCVRATGPFLWPRRRAGKASWPRTPSSSVTLLTLPGHFKSGLATSICSPTDVMRGGDGRSLWHRKRSRSLAGAVFGGARAQEAAELGTAVPARSAGPERAQEPAADGDQPGVVGP